MGNSKEKRVRGSQTDVGKRANSPVLEEAVRYVVHLYAGCAGEQVQLSLYHANIISKSYKNKVFVINLNFSRKKYNINTKFFESVRYLYTASKSHLPAQFRCSYGQFILVHL